jgi:hypothetical protein
MPSSRLKGRAKSAWAASAHKAKARDTTKLLAPGANIVFRATSEMRNLPLGEIERLGLGEFFCVE